MRLNHTSSRLSHLQSPTALCKQALECSVPVICRSRGKSYVIVVEFPSYEDAMRNSALPETSEFAGRMMALCDGPPTFRNLDVQGVQEF